MSSSLRISYLHQYFTPPKSAGGTRSYEFARRLIAAGHKVQMITSSAYLPDEFQGRPERIFNAEIAGIPSIVVNLPYSSSMRFTVRIKAFIAFAFWASVITMRQPADVIFATSTPLTIAVPAVFGRLWRRIPMVFEVRDLWPELPIAVNAIKNPLLIWAAHQLEYLAYRNSSQIVALSPGMKDGIVNTGYPEQDIHVIPNSCDIDFFAVGKQVGINFRKQFQWLGDRPLVIYAGTLGMINGVGYLAQLAKEMMTLNPEVRFLVIGRGGLEEISIRLLAEKLGVFEQNFFMIPQIPKEQMPAALSAADVATSLFIDLPEMQNNSANKFFDALASGTPVAINYGGWQAGLLKDSGAGIVLDSLNVERAAQSLNHYLNDKQQILHSQSAAMELARTAFNRDDMALKLEKVLRYAADSKQN